MTGFTIVAYKQLITCKATGFDTEDYCTCMAVGLKPKHKAKTLHRQHHSASNSLLSCDAEVSGLCNGNYITSLTNTARVIQHTMSVL